MKRLIRLAVAGLAAPWALVAAVAPWGGAEELSPPPPAWPGAATPNWSVIISAERAVNMPPPSQDEYGASSTSESLSAYSGEGIGPPPPPYADPPSWTPGGLPPPLSNSLGFTGSPGNALQGSRLRHGPPDGAAWPEHFIRSGHAPRISHFGDWFPHRDPNDPARHVGKGRPLDGTSWLNRPYHVGWCFGTLLGDDLIGGRVGQNGDLFGGYRLGWDVDHYWGTEVRFAFARLDVTDSQDPPEPRSSSDWFFDAHLVYYPWGDCCWRPYISAGLGIAEFRFLDENDSQFNEVLFHLPIGVGMKFYYRPWLALRIDLMDNIAFGSAGLDTMHNVSFTGGVEVHFGGERVSYGPWTNSLQLR
jgi:hypothetical protein